MTRTPPNCRRSAGRLDAGTDGGCFFGEMALIDELARVATVRTLGPVKMLVLRGHMFHDFLECVPDFKRRLTQIQEKRKNEMGQAIENANYLSVLAEKGTNRLETEFGASAGAMHGARSTSRDYADSYADKYPDEFMLKEVRGLMKAPTQNGRPRSKSLSW